MGMVCCILTTTQYLTRVCACGGCGRCVDGSSVERTRKNGCTLTKVSAEEEDLCARSDTFSFFLKNIFYA